MLPPMAKVPVVLEIGSKRTFACALDWPGWARSARSSLGDEAALAALMQYAVRYAPIADRAGYGARFDTVARAADRSLTVVDHLAGDATTDFGAPSRSTELEEPALVEGDARRVVALLDAGWQALDELAASAPALLRKGPRGGGRDRDAVVAHVVNAEVAYARKLGLRQVSPPDPQSPAEVDDVRQRIRGALASGLREAAPSDARRWPPRYTARRMAWHVLDHVWEIEDRIEPGPRSP